MTFDLTILSMAKGLAAHAGQTVLEGVHGEGTVHVQVAKQHASLGNELFGLPRICQGHAGPRADLPGSLVTGVRATTD